MNPDPSDKSAAVEEALVRVYNKSAQQTFTHAPYVLPPSSFLNVPVSVAERWYRLFRDIVVEAGVAQKELGGVQAELNAERAKVAALQAELEKLKAPADPKKKNSILSAGL